eukprot:5959136-Prymnesium_polylepis.4
MSDSHYHSFANARDGTIPVFSSRHIAAANSTLTDYSGTGIHLTATDLHRAELADRFVEHELALVKANPVTVSVASPNGGGGLAVNGNTLTFTPPLLSTYLTTSTASSTYFAKSGGTITGDTTFGSLSTPVDVTIEVGSTKFLKVDTGQDPSNSSVDIGMQIGNVTGFFPQVPGLAHVGYCTLANYALIRSTSDGTTLLNAPVAATLNLRKGNVDKLACDTNGNWTFSSDVAFGSNSVTATTFTGALSGTATGNVPIPGSGQAAGKVVAVNAANNGWEFVSVGGGGGLNTDHVHAGTFAAGDANGDGVAKIGNTGHQYWAGFAHEDCFNTSDFALLQSNTGHTILNCKSGQTLFIQQGNSTKASIDANGDWSIAGYQNITGSKSVTLARLQYTLVSYAGWWVAPPGLSNATPTVATNLSLKADSGCYGGTFYTSSDDRRKHNECQIPNAMNIIRELKPVVYEKTEKMYLNGETRPDSDTDYIVEAGFIAQDVQKIPELAFTVR